MVLTLTTPMDPDLNLLQATSTFSIEICRLSYHLFILDTFGAAFDLVRVPSWTHRSFSPTCGVLCVLTLYEIRDLK